MTKVYQEITIKTFPFNPEILTGIVMLFDFLGIEERENELTCYFNNFSENDLKTLNQLLNNLKKESLIERFEIYQSTIEQKNWNEEWEKSIQPIKVGNRIVIKPSFRDYEKKDGEIVITIDPKMSFGTGYHQSTRIMIRLIERYIHNGFKVLDVGTGTGILSIVALKLGASKVYACDIDENVQENFYENLALNGISENCFFTAGSIKEIKEKDFDLVLANIQRNILIDIAGDIAERTKKGGLVILAGLLVDDQDEICTIYKSFNLKFIETEIEDEWIGIVFQLL